MIHIDLTILVTCIIAFVGMLGYLANILAKGVICLTALKKDVETIKTNQTDIKKDVEDLENSFLKLLTKHD